MSFWVLARLAAPAAAQDAVPVRVEYRAPPTCPDRASFLTKVSARTPLFRASDEAPRAFVVEMALVDGGFEGRLTTVEPSQARATRELSGDTCEQVVSALALVAALTLESNASATPEVAPPPPRESEPRPQLEPSLASAPAPARVWHLDAGLGANVTGAVAPNVLVGIGPFVEGSLALRSLAPAVRLSFQGGPATSQSVEGGGTASFTWWLATLEGCARWTFGAFGLSPCARLGMGALKAEGSHVAQTRADRRPWVDAGGLLRLRWSPASFWFLEATGGFVLPITRDRFHFDTPDTTIHRAAPAGGLVGGDIGVRFL